MKIDPDQEILKMKSVAAVIVLYNPDEKVNENFELCQEQVDKVYIIDNSETSEKATEQIKSRSQVELISQGSNLGVAAALNIAADKARTDDYKYLLTLDQDTIIPQDLVSVLLSTIQSDKMAAIAAPFYSNINYDLYPQNSGVASILVVPTSANLLDLNAYRDIGRFSDDLFIDYVDFDYCLRLNLKGYKILQNNSIIVKHNVGNLVRNNFLGLKFYTTNHPPTRLYYRTRNRFYIREKYFKYFPQFFRKDIINLIKEIIKIIIVENKKLEKLKMILLGFRHYRSRSLGKLNIE